MDTELNSEAYSRAVAEVLMGNSVAQNVHIRQMVFVEGNGEMFTKGPVGHAVVVTPKGGSFQGKDDGVHACVSSWQRICDNSIPPRVKCAANYQNGRLALLRARLDGYDCALLLNDRGKVSEEPGGSFSRPAKRNHHAQDHRRHSGARYPRDGHNTPAGSVSARGH